MCKIVESPLCVFCKQESESIVHLFWECPIVAALWKNFEKLLQEKCVTCSQFTLTERLILFGQEDNITMDRIVNFMILICKFFIYKCRFQKIAPTIERLLIYLKVKYLDEKYVADMNFQYDFGTKWMLYTPLFM